jgi:hypothetical protein
MLPAAQSHMECGGSPPLSRSPICRDKSLYARLASRAEIRKLK